MGTSPTTKCTKNKGKKYKEKREKKEKKHLQVVKYGNVIYLPIGLFLKLKIKLFYFILNY